MAGPRLRVSARLQRLEARVCRAERWLRAALGLQGRLRALERRLRTPRPHGGGSGLRAPGDASIQIKQEEESCAVVQQEGEAGAAPEEPRPDHIFHQPEASTPTRKVKELFCKELPGAGSEDVPEDPVAGLQNYTTHVLSWIKQEEEPRCPERRDVVKEEPPRDPSTAHGEATKRDPLAAGFEISACDSGVPGQPEEKFSKDCSSGMTWDSQWNPETMETTPLGGDAAYERGFGDHLEFFSAQENGLGRRSCVYKHEGDSSQRDHLQAPHGAQEGEMPPGSTCEKPLADRMFHLLPSQSCASVEKELGLVSLSERGHNPTSGTRLGETPPGSTCEKPLTERMFHSPPCPPVEKELGLVSRSERGHDPTSGTRLGELPVENEEGFPAALTTSCCVHPQERSEPCAKCRQQPPVTQAPSQPRGKSYICSDCGKSFDCHSWLVRHQTTHTGERPYKCSECDKSYRRKDYLLNHQRRHSGEGLFQCPLCKKRFVLRRSLVKHQDSHVQQPPLTLGGWSCADAGGSVLHPA